MLYCIKCGVEREKGYTIYTLGWCDYAHYALLSNEVNVHKPKKLTKEQEVTLFKLFELNNDDMDYYFRTVQED